MNHFTVSIITVLLFQTFIHILNHYETTDRYKSIFFFTLSISIFSVDLLFHPVATVSAGKSS